MRRGRLNLLVLGATMACVAAAVTGCGSSESDSTTTASPPETWATGVCSSITTWQAALTSAAGSLKSDPTKDGLQTAADDAKSATQTLASDLKDLGKPDTEAGQQAKDSLDQLSTSLQKDVDTIEETVDGVSGASEVLTAVSTVAGTLATMRDRGQDNVHRPPGARREGRVEGRIHELQRLRLPHFERFMTLTRRRGLGRPDGGNGVPSGRPEGRMRDTTQRPG